MSFKNKVTTSSISVYFLIVIVFVLIRMLGAFGLLSFMGEAANYVFNIIVQIGLMLTTSIFLFSALIKKKPKSVANFFGYRKISLRSAFISIGIGFCVFILNIFIATFFSIILQLFGYKFSQNPEVTSYPFYMLLVNVIMTALLPAVCEETAHRGLVLKGLGVNNKMTALVISSLLFGLMHMNIEQFFYATIIGFIVGYLSLMTGSIYPAMIIHFMNNFLNVYMSFSRVNGLPLGKGYSWLLNTISSNILIGTMLVALISFLLVFALIFLVKKLKKDNDIYAMKRIQTEVVRELIHNDYLHQVDNARFEATGFKEERKYEEGEPLDKKLGFISEIEEELIADKSKRNLSILSKIILISTFVLLTGVTIFTFVWGVL